MCNNWNIYRQLSLLPVVVLLLLLGQTSAEPFNPNTDWFKEAGWGVFVHYLWDVQCVGERISTQDGTTDWDACVKEFDTEVFAEQIKRTGAGYVIFTMHQRTRYLIAPNETFDKLTGYKPGQACSTRDLVEDLYTSLNKRGIPLMLYWTGDGPRQDKKASDGFGGWAGKVTDEYVQNWASVVAEYGKRYGKKIAGWWVDGCYDNIGYNEKRWGILAEGLRQGNSKRIIALNNPQMTRSNSSTVHDDYTTGEQNTFNEIPDSRWRDEKQWHILSYLGHGWGASGLRYGKQQMTDYIYKCNSVGGVVSVDILLFRDGSMDKSQVEFLKSVSKRLKEKEAWKYKKAIPEGNVACYKPARLLDLNGKEELSSNGGGGTARLAKYGTDGKLNTWAQPGGQWPWSYEVDMVDLYDVKHVVVTFNKDGYATHLKVRLSADGIKWVTVAEKDGHDGIRIELTFAQTASRYIRIESHKPDGPNQPGGQMQIVELEVYK